MDIRLIKAEDLEQLLKKNKFPKYRSKQIENWARKTDIKSFNQMSNLPNDLIDFLISSGLLLSIFYYNINAKYEKNFFLLFNS